MPSGGVGAPEAVARFEGAGIWPTGAEADSDPAAAHQQSQGVGPAVQGVESGDSSFG